MTVYNLKSIRMPCLTGVRLKIFTAALDNPLIGPLLVRRLNNTTGLAGFRRIHLAEPPTRCPLYPDTESGRRGQDIGPGALLRAVGNADARGELPFPTVRDFAIAYRSGGISPETVGRRLLEAVDAADKDPLPLRLFVRTDRADVLTQARESAGRFARGKPLSLLDGVPVAVKDELDQRPYPTTAGTAFLGQRPATEDATVVRRLRQAGAVLIGKTNMHEIGINPNGYNRHYGTVRNPHHPARESGGSSSGSAAAVATGICPAAVGVDGGGSIRIPAALCGIVGLKPTFGRVSEHGDWPLCPSVAHVGPMGACAEDVAMVYAVIAGADPRDPLTRNQPAPRLNGWDRPDLGDLTVGIFPEWFNHAADSVVQVCRRLVDHLIRCGASLREIVIPDLDQMRVAHGIVILSEMAAAMAAHRAHRRRFGLPVRVNLALGAALTARDYDAALRLRTRAMASFAGVLETVDVVLSPATAVTAPPIPGGDPNTGWSDLGTVSDAMRFVFPANLVGLPAICFPAGYDPDGLPIGMQAMGRPWEEATLLRVARAAESGVLRRVPQVFFKLLD
jgi:Asp-tRNA(Asn)/Glu-tRNA(Gln) amidotransferase A subunit family amidase